MLLDVGSHVMPMATGSFLGELKGVVLALKKTRSIRGSLQTIVYSDNEAVVNKLKHGVLQEDDIRVCRCWEYLLHNEPQCKYFYVPGTENGGADGLSRLRLNERRLQASVCPVVHQRPDPDEIRRRIIQGHFGHWDQEITLRNTQLEFGNWPRMMDDVAEFVKRCPNCAFSGHPQVRDDPDVTIIKHIGERVCIDYAGPYFDKSYILMVIDEASRYVEAHRTWGTGAEHAIDALEAWMIRFGNIETIRADNAA